MARSQRTEEMPAEAEVVNAQEELQEAKPSNEETTPEMEILRRMLQMQREIEELKAERAEPALPKDHESERLGIIGTDHAQLVYFTVPINEANPKDKVLNIAINGHWYNMLRGETVQVPEFVVLEYLDSMKQKRRTMNLQEKYAQMVNLSR